MRLNLILRTAICLEVGLFVTFTQSHNILIGLEALTSFGVGYALVTLFVALLQRKKLNSYANLPLAALALVIGLVATQVPAAAGLFWFRILVAAWGLLSGAYELYLARRTGFKSVTGKELMVSSIMGLILGILFITVPLQALDAVGFFGAYMVVCAVHLGISAASERSTAN